MKLVYLLIIVFYLPIGSWTQNSSNSTSLDFRIHSICEELTRERIVESERIGSIALPSEQWRRFKSLLLLSDDSILCRLIDHQSPTVRAYAFWGLIIVNSPFLMESIKKHESDSATITSRNGCIGSIETVYNFVIRTAYHEAKKLNLTDRLIIEQAYNQIREKQLTLRRKLDLGN